MSDFQYTREQFEALGRLVVARTMGRQDARLTVHPELAGDALLAVVWEFDTRVVFGIERDGYTHT